MKTWIQSTQPRLPLSMQLMVLGSLLIKMGLLQCNAGEYTDGILQLQLWNAPVSFFPPGYGSMVYLVNRIVPDILIAGRVVSIVASVLTLIAFYYLAREVLQNETQAQWSTLFLALSPVFNRWSIRVMTDSLFCLGFVLCTYMLMRIWNGQSKRLCVLIGLTGLFALVRYQALFFVPFIVWLLYQHRNDWKGISAFSAFKSGVIALIPWFLFGSWLAFRGFEHHEQFAERASYGVWITVMLYGRMFETFVLYFPWAVTFGLFAAGVVGMIVFFTGSTSQKRFLLFFGIAALVFLGVQSAFLSFQYRYLLPLVPLWCLFAGYGAACIAEMWKPAGWKRSVYAVVVLNLSVMTGCVWYYQRATFGDLVDSALYLREIGKESRVLSDETYGLHAANVKMQFWSGREILSLHEHEPQAGDLLVLHNTYTLDMEKYIESLRTRFQAVPIRRWSAQQVPGAYTTIPLLPDIMVSPALLDAAGRRTSMTSNPECMVFRFTPQYYYSVVIRLSEK